MHETNRTQPLYIRLIFSLVIFILFIGITEVILRLVEPNLYHKNQRFPVNRDVDFPEVYEKDHDLFWRFRTDQTIDSKMFSNITYHINSTGMRGKEIKSDPALYRIIALGNSCTFGWGVPEDSIWTTSLESVLQELMPEYNFEVLNCGVPGYSSYQGKKYFINELLPYKPKILLIMFGWNDQWAAGGDISDKDQKLPGQFILSLQNYFSRLKFYQLFRKVFLSLTETEKEVSLVQLSGKRRVSREDFQNNLREIIKVAKRENIIPIVMVPPIASLKNYQLGTISPFHKHHESYQEKVINAGRYENIMVINHQPEFDRYNDLFNNPSDDPIHFNAAGHQLFTKSVLETILPVIE